MAGSHQAVLLPGIVLPADLAYEGLVAALGDEADARPTELAIYRGDEPPAGYSLDDEVEGLLAAADAAGFERFHAVGYSGGGAAALAFAARRPERLLSLALLEPAWIGWSGLSAPEQEFWGQVRRLRDLPAERLLPEFATVQLRQGVEPPAPPDGAPPPWMAKRPAGIRALTAAFERSDVDHAALRRFERPVYYALGGRSNPDVYERQAFRLEQLFPDFTLEIFRERHHFDPPHRVEPERLAASLIELWRRA